MGVALGLNSAVVGSLKKSPWTDLDAKALEETGVEVEKGWLAESKEVTCADTSWPKGFPYNRRTK